MRRVWYLFLLMSFVGCIVCFAAENPAIGKWDCVSDDGHGAIRNWVLVVGEFQGKLNGSFVSVEEGESLPLIDPAFKDDLLTYKAFVNSNCTLSFKLKIYDKKLDGTFECPEVSGTMTGAKNTAGGASGKH